MLKILKLLTLQDNNGIVQKADVYVSNIDPLHLYNS